MIYLDVFMFPIHGNKLGYPPMDNPKCVQMLHVCPPVALTLEFFDVEICRNVMHQNFDSASAANHGL
jgi:hypothetical protein